MRQPSLSQRVHPTSATGRHAARRERAAQRQDMDRRVRAVTTWLRSLGSRRAGLR